MTARMSGRLRNGYWTLFQIQGNS